MRALRRPVELKAVIRPKNRPYTTYTLSIDLNIGDLIRVKRLGGCWLGFLIDHRSGAFGLIDIFGSVNGGSNYNTGYIECEF